MKIDKKCPNCGRLTRVDSTAEDVRCEYCDQLLPLERTEEPKQVSEPEYVEAVFKNNILSVVAIEVEKIASPFSSESHKVAGTGFIISDKGYLLTNHHVVFDGYPISIALKFIDPNQQSADFVRDLGLIAEKVTDVQIVDANKSRDLALLSFDAQSVLNKFKAVEFDTSLRPGQACVLIGNAKDHGLGPEPGYVHIPKLNALGDVEFAGRSNGGDSGGPIFNQQNKVIAIQKGKHRDAEGISYATSSSDIIKLVKGWEKKHGIKVL